MQEEEVKISIPSLCVAVRCSVCPGRTGRGTASPYTSRAPQRTSSTPSSTSSRSPTIPRRAPQPAPTRCALRPAARVPSPTSPRTGTPKAPRAAVFARAITDGSPTVTAEPEVVNVPHEEMDAMQQRMSLDVWLEPSVPQTLAGCPAGDPLALGPGRLRFSWIPLDREGADTW